MHANVNRIMPAEGGCNMEFNRLNPLAGWKLGKLKHFHLPLFLQHKHMDDILLLITQRFLCGSHHKSDLGIYCRFFLVTASKSRDSLPNSTVEQGRLQRFKKMTDCQLVRNDKCCSCQNCPHSMNGKLDGRSAV